MKQYINKQQWLELSKEEQEIIANFFFEKYKTQKINALLHNNINIGFLIEFLDGFPFIEIKLDDVRIHFPEDKNFFAGGHIKHLCDLLWEACKYKLKH
jgi:hypothetical protein